MEDCEVRSDADDDRAWYVALADPVVGRRNLRGSLIRLRRGSAAAAWRRLGFRPTRGRSQLQGAIDLVTIAPCHAPEVTLVAGAVSRALVDEGRIELAADTSTFDLAFAYAHEVGHLFDVTMLDDADRAAFSDAVGTDHPWTGGRYHHNVEEAWASAFAVVTCAGPWRCTLWAPCNWPEDRTRQVLGACRDLIEAAAAR